MTSEVVFYSLAAGSAGCAVAAAYPWASRVWNGLAGHLEEYQQARVEQTAKALDDLFLEVQPRWLKIAYGLGPILLGLLAFLLSTNVWVGLVGVVVGALLPDVWLRQARRLRRRTFQAQLVDALFILSSSLRAGLSLTQAFEQLETEMPAPASQEFGLMMKAHWLGLSLDEALQRLNERMPCEELTLITTAVLMARETGGDITTIISQLITTIRERKKLSDKVATLTLQGKVQAYVMSALPLVFAFFVRSFNAHYFDILFQDPIGRSIMVLAGALWLVGMVLLLRLSRVDVI